MLRNLEIFIKHYREPSYTNFKGTTVIHFEEDFHTEFNAIAYYYFLKLKNIKIPGATWLNLHLYNCETANVLSVKHIEKFVNVEWNYDFTAYQKMSLIQKKLTQFELIHTILVRVFSAYKLDIVLLNEIAKGITASENKMTIEGKRKRVNKKYWFQIVYEFNLDSFSFFAKVDEDKMVSKILIATTKPDNFSITCLFRRMKIEVETITLGSQFQEIFKIDLASKTAEVLTNSQHLVDEWAVP